MMKMKQLLFFCNLAAGLFLLPPLALATKGGKNDSTATATPEKRLVLSPQAHLQLSTEPIWGDSVEAIVTVAVPDSCKNQRYLCRIEANISLRLLTIPRYKWAVSTDSLKVLSALPLQIRIARQNFAASAPSIKLHFKNLDHAGNLSGIAALTILPEAQMSQALPPARDSLLAATPAVDSMKIAATAPVTTAAEAMATANEPNAFGIFYVVLAIALIFMFGGMSWLMKWSQRRRFQSIAAKTTALAFPHLQNLEPAPAPEPHNSTPAVAEKVTKENAAATSATPAAMSSNLPAVIAADQQFDLALVLAQLQELKLNLQQIIANQQEVNHRLAQITVAAALEAPKASAQLALFDILNEDSTVRNGENHANGNNSSARHFSTVEDYRSANLPGEITSALTHVTKDSSRLASPSSLRIFFANAESKAEPSEEILLH